MEKEKTIETCIWHENQECHKAKLYTNPDGKCDGKNLKCFAYTPKHFIMPKNKQELDYQI